jgi:hypothetical protein
MKIYAGFYADKMGKKEKLVTKLRQIKKFTAFHRKSDLP